MKRHCRPRRNAPCLARCVLQDTNATRSRSQKTKLSKLASERFGHIRSPGRSVVEIRGRLFRVKVAPPLESAHRAGLRQYQPGRQNELASADPVGVGKGPHVAQPLPAHYLTADDPIERSSVEEFIRPFGRHAGGMHMLARLAAALLLRELRPDPGVELFDRITADAKLDEMQGHRGP